MLDNIKNDRKHVMFYNNEDQAKIHVIKHVMKEEIMSKTISLIMQKGGSGKTTICDQLAFSLREMGKTVEVIDLDDQQSSRFVNEEIEEPEYTIIDTRGALDMPIELNGENLSIEDVIESSDLVIIPFLPEADSEAPLANVVSRCKKVGTDYRIVFNKLDMRRVVDQIMFQNVCADYPGKVMKTALHQGTAVSQARLLSKSINDVDSNSKPAKDFSALVKEVLEVVNNG